MFNNQEVGLRNDVGLLDVKDHDDYMVDLKQFDHDDIHLQVVPDFDHQDDELLNKDANQEVGNYESLLVPDEHSETGDHHHHHQQHHHDHVYYSNDHNKKEKQPKRRRRSLLMTLSDEESSDSGYTREVPSVTRKVCKRRQKRRREETMNHKMLKLQQLLPISHKRRDEVSVLDNAIDHMKDLRLQIQVMSMMGLNPYMTSPYPYAIHNHPSTALTMSHGQNPTNQATSSPFIPALNWPLTPLTSLSSYSFSPNGLVPCFPSFMDHIGRW